jgi:hypothetical protein
MRGSWRWALGGMLGLLLVLAAPPPAGAVAGCPTQTGMQDASRHTKPSSFEPHARPPGNAYGMPIGDKILSKRVKKKKPAAPSAPRDALA